MVKNETERSRLLAPVRRIVVKIGSSSLTTSRHQLDRSVLRQLVGDVVTLRQRGLEVAIVSSGAVAAGMGRLGLEKRPRAVAQLQAVAAVGQNQLIEAYKTLFWRSQIPVGQVLLTASDILGDRRRYLNLANTFRQLFAYGAVPVINENDSVAVAELKRQIGENDMLAAYVANLIGAQLLVMLSDVAGVYAGYGRDGPEGEPLAQVGLGDPVFQLAGRGGGTRVGSGGMQTKLRAARLLMMCGEMSIVAHARRHRLLDVVGGALVGTLFLPGGKKLGRRKRWIGFASECRGTLIVDEGACRALTEQDRSLLPVGVVNCQGAFAAGDVVRVQSESGQELARGVTRYGCDDLRRAQGKSSPEIAAELGRPAAEVIHRDDLAVVI